MPKSVFISRIWEDRHHASAIASWAAQGQLGSAVVTGESEDVRQDGQAAIRQHLSPKLQGAAAVVVLVGNDAHNRRWLDYEIRHALTNRKAVVAMRIPGTTGGVPPLLLGTGELPFSATALRRWLGT